MTDDMKNDDSTGPIETKDIPLRNRTARTIQQIPLTFYTRRQNTNHGQDQYRIWAPRTEANRLAEVVPELKAALASGATYSWDVTVAWNNGSCAKKLAFGTYRDSSGELAFTASRETYLFEFARDHDAVIQGTYVIHPIYEPRLKLDLDLPAAPSR